MAWTKICNLDAGGITKLTQTESELGLFKFFDRELNPFCISAVQCQSTCSYFSQMLNADLDNINAIYRVLKPVQFSYCLLNMASVPIKIE